MLGRNHGGNWNSTTPSFPAECSGISARRNSSHDSSTAASGRCDRYTDRFSRCSIGTSSATSGQSESGRVGWLVNSE